MYKTDIVIIGAGPTGIFSAFQAGMLGMKCHIIDILDHIGGQCTALYPEKPIYDIPGYPIVSAASLIEKLNEQAMPFNPIYHLKQQVIEYKDLGNSFVVKTNTGTEIETKIIIIAAGAGAFCPNRPPLEGISEYEGKSIFYSVRNKADFAGKNIAIAGGGDSAIDWAINLANIANKIYLIHRRDKFRCAPSSYEEVNRLKELGKIDLVIPYQLHKLHGKLGLLDKIELSDFDGNTIEIETDILLPFFGLAMELGPLKNWGLNLHFNHINVNSITCETNIPGIYAVGDVAHYEGKLKLILTGFAEVASAMHHAYSRVFDGKALHFEYSTSKGISKS